MTQHHYLWCSFKDFPCTLLSLEQPPEGGIILFHFYKKRWERRKLSRFSRVTWGMRDKLQAQGPKSTFHHLPALSILHGNPWVQKPVQRLANLIFPALSACEDISPQIRSCLFPVPPAAGAREGSICLNPPPQIEMFYFVFNSHNNVVKLREGNAIFVSTRVSL